MARIPDALLLPDALEQHFRSNGLAPDGGYASPWVTFRIAGIPMAMPNIEARRAVVKHHDVHHVLTGYGTDWPGEMEIGAWEIATGCAHSRVAFVLNISAFGVGAILHPVRTFRAWWRGRNSRNLYGERYADLLLQSVGVLRRRADLDRPTPEPGLGDRVGFALWAGLGLLVGAAPFAALAGLGWSLL